MNLPDPGRIDVDEVGIAFVAIGPLLLKTAYQPIFARQGPVLVPIAVSAVSVLERGRQALIRDEVDQLTADDRAIVDCFAGRLAVRNLANVGADLPDLQLIVGLERAADLAALVDEGASVDVDPGRLIVDVSAIVQDAQLTDLLQTVTRMNAFAAVDIFGATDLPLPAETGNGLCVARIPAQVFRRMMSDNSLQRLFPPLVSALRRRQFLVQIEGIEHRDDFCVAIAVGADRMQGGLLGGSALAGTDFDDRPRALSDLVGDRGNVVSLSA